MDENLKTDTENNVYYSVANCHEVKHRMVRDGMGSTSISPVEYIMEEYMWNMICLFSQKGDVNSFCYVTACCIKHYWSSDVKNSHGILCKSLQFWSGVAEVFILLECGAASLGAYQYAVLHNVMCIFVCVRVCIYINMSCEGFAFYGFYSSLNHT
jgi:hypothetical protein